MHRIAFVVSPNFQLISVGALSAFEMANFAVQRRIYEVDILSEAGGTIVSSLGPSVDSVPIGGAAYGTAIFAGGLDRTPTPLAVTEFARHSLRHSRRVASICTGAFALAEAGVLDGRHVTTHWAAARDLQARFPLIKVDGDRIFIVDGSIWTSAGATAGIDLVLGMIEQDLGRELAKTVSRQLVLYHRRGGGQSQHSALLEMAPKTDRIQSAIEYARRNLHLPLGVEDLAEAAHLSPRQFSRIFRAETGQTPAKAVENLRVEAARSMMEQSSHSIEAIAEQTGFTDRERMRRAFLRSFGQSPQAIRRTLNSG